MHAVFIAVFLFMSIIREQAKAVNKEQSKLKAIEK